MINFLSKVSTVLTFLKLTSSKLLQKDLLMSPIIWTNMPCIIQKLVSYDKGWHLYIFKEACTLCKIIVYVKTVANPGGARGDPLQKKEGGKGKERKVKKRGKREWGYTETK